MRKPDRTPGESSEINVNLGVDRLDAGDNENITADNRPVCTENSGSLRARGSGENLLPYRYLPGESGNPGGRRKIDPIVKKMLIDATPVAAQALIDLVQDKQVSPKVRCQAAEVILERVYGKAVQPIDAQIGGSGDPMLIQFQGVLADWAK